MMQVNYFFNRLVLPILSSKKAAGYDLSAAHSGVVPKRGKALIKTDLAMIIPENYYGRVAPRSVKIIIL
jgi:dUTP pyrophosphatase